MNRFLPIVLAAMTVACAVAPKTTERADPSAPALEPLDSALQTARLRDAASMRERGELVGAKQLVEQVLEIYSRTLPDDHRDVQVARVVLSDTLRDLGDLNGSRELAEKVLDSFSRALPPEHSDVLAAQEHLALTCKELGDLSRAQALETRVLEVRARTLPRDHPDLQRVQGNFAVTLMMLGDFHGARELNEALLDEQLRSLPADHLDVQATRENLALTCMQLGDLRRARELEEQVLEVRSRSLPEEHPDLQAAIENLALFTREIGDLHGARKLQERLLEVRARTLPEDHPDLLAARESLGGTLHLLGDLLGARALFENVLDVRLATLPEEHAEVQGARQNLAATLRLLGDFQGARALEEKVLEVRSSTLPEDHPDLQDARSNLAATLIDLGELDDAQQLAEAVLETRSRILPDEHPDVQVARANLAVVYMLRGDFARARPLLDQVLEVYARTLPDDHPDVQRARMSLTSVLLELRDLPRAEELAERVLEVNSRTLPDDHVDLQKARENVAIVSALLAREQRTAPDRFGELLHAYARVVRHATASLIRDASSREAEERIHSRDRELGNLLSFATGLGVFTEEPSWQTEAFLASESTRCAALASARLSRAAHGDAEYQTLRNRARDASDALASLARTGGSADAFARARKELEGAQRELVRRASSLGGLRADALEPELDSIAARLQPNEALVAFRQYGRNTIDAGEVAREQGAPHMCAFVLRPTRPDAAASLVRIELGAVEPIETAVAQWRATLGVSSGRGVSVGTQPVGDERARAASIRALVLDPLQEHLADVDRLIVEADGVLHAVPLEALPAGERLVGDRWNILTRLSLLDLDDEPASDSAPMLVTLGGAAFGANADSPPVALRGGAFEQGFAPLPGTLEEARGIQARFAEVWGASTRAVSLEGDAASRANLLEIAPSARFLHLATHGWFAPESVPSIEDPPPIDRRARLPMREDFRGMHPMLLCGLALAGANRAADSVGHVAGLLTAEEISNLDLSNCELAVLSACDTNVGVRRTGQGVASLQRALHMAGARSVITSLWKVPDEATKDLMLEFYRRLWVEKQPKWRALWEAKRTLRDAKDERGAPKYTTRDWAAWVLTGEPD